ncbi:MAG: glycosyltransferase family 4 protein [Victivallaceae bacterium]|nr:glycosyltransferase family 4 protein [Victivallaceae bacterium]
MMIHLCIWMNIPSHHQHSFFEALAQRNDVDLTVRYYDTALLASRRENGWITPTLCDYEKITSVDAIGDPALRQYFHIIPIFDSRGGKKLAVLAVKHHLKWCSWGERSGAKIAKYVFFNPFLFRVLDSVFNRLRLRKYISFLRNDALFSFAQGRLAAEQLKSFGVPEKKMRFLCYSVPAQPDKSPEETITRFKCGRTAFLISATLCARKGIVYILDAYAKLPEMRRKSACLVFVGSGNKTPYEMFCRKRRISDGVLFFGRCDSDKIASVYRACDVCVLPTLHDGWGVVLNEAASIGMPLISTTECGAAWHLIRQGENGFRVPSKSSKDLRDAMLFYLEDPENIVRHGRESRKIFAEFTPEANAQRMISCLSETEN